MNHPWQKFELSEGMLRSLEKKLAGKDEIFTFRSEPLLASLISCLGIQFELGKADQDRVSALLGVELAPVGPNPWETEIITWENRIGLRAWIPGREELLPHHEDFSLILHPLSMSTQGKLEQLVIFPELVATAYESRGIELVVVKEWAMSAFISRNRNLNYQKTNLTEIESNIALTQIRLMQSRQLAFTGTHDLADHLLGGAIAGIKQSDELLAKIKTAFGRAFSTPAHKRSALVVSYLIAVLLDDLAQPQWYSSQQHKQLAELALGLMHALESRADISVIFLPASFHRMIEMIRSRTVPWTKFEESFREFSLELQNGIAAPSLASGY